MNAQNFMEPVKSKILVVYYSLTGNTKLAAETVAKEIAADILELKLQKETDSRGLLRILWRGYQALTKKKSLLVPFSIIPMNYDLIVVCQPCWNSRMTPPIRSFLQMFNFKGKKIAILISSGGEENKTIKRLKTELSESIIVDTINVIDPKKKDTTHQLELIKNWARKLIS